MQEWRDRFGVDPVEADVILTVSDPRRGTEIESERSTSPIRDAFEAILGQYLEAKTSQPFGSNAEIWTEQLPPPYDLIRQKVADCDGLVSLLTDRIDAALLDAAPRLKVVSNYAVGFNNVDVKAATERGVCVGNTPGVIEEPDPTVTAPTLLTSDTDPLRYNLHPANIRGVRIRLTVRSLRLDITQPSDWFGDPATPPDGSASIENCDNFVVVTLGRYRRYFSSATVSTPNLGSKDPFIF